MLALFPFSSKGEEAKAPKKTQLEIPQDAALLENIRVLVREGVPAVEFNTAHPFRAYDEYDNPLFQGAQIVKTRVRVEGGKIVLGAQKFSGEGLRIESDGPLQVDGKTYRDSILFRRVSDGTLKVINDLPLEDYLKGVLPSEMISSWHGEALKAQAVASRTYAVFNMIEKADQDYDVTSDVLHQVYRGQGGEHPATDKAVDHTRGQILTYQGKIFPAYFHSTSGGATARAHDVWDVEAHPSLMGVRDEFSSDSKHYRWQQEFSEKTILDKLRLQGYSLSGIDRMQAVDPDDFGRARKILVVSGGKEYRFRSSDFRMWMGAGDWKSTKITGITKNGGRFTVKGAGWGHGVGLCQYSAKKLAEIGYSYQRILAFFYPGSSLMDLETYSER
ncbi:MAG: SpoIID/LytB domain-containing protein [Candidatus Omnitrophota bacterium]